MARRFRRSGYGITGRLSPSEVAVLRSVIVEVLDLLEPDEHPATDELAELTGMHLPPAPDVTAHPALARLFPDAYDDPAAAEAFRVLAHGALAADKRAALARMREDLPGDSESGAVLRLDDEAAALWLSGLNDLRLAVGTAIGIGPGWEEEVETLTPDDPAWVGIAVYDVLTTVQGALIDTLSRP